MTAEGYERLARWFRARPRALRALVVLDGALRVAFYAAYAALLAVLAIAAAREGAGLGGWLGTSGPLGRWWRLGACVAVPAAAFAALSAYRRHRDAPRPQEALGITPLIAREGTGRSFPSRHVFSCFVIAGSWLVASVPVALALMALGVVVAVVRVVGGVHFPRDVLAGALVGLASGVLTTLVAGAVG